MNLFIILNFLYLSFAYTYSMDMIWYPSYNFNARFDKKLNKPVEKPTILVLHYTASTLESTLEYFKTNGTVSSHYTVAKNGTIYHHVKEQDRAWHAGVGNWREVSDLNSYSIGIEIENLGYRVSPNQPEGILVNGSSLEWYPFDHPEQVEAVVKLSADIVKRHSIEPRNVIAHADLAPGRKEDPGPLFFWSRLAKENIGAWVGDGKPNSTQQVGENFNVSSVQEKLRRYGYTSVPLSEKYDNKTRDGLVAFQMHFRPWNISGDIDGEIVSILDELLKKYVDVL